MEDEGEYVCQGQGGLARAQLYVQEEGDWGAGGGAPAWGGGGSSRAPVQALPPCPAPTVTIEPPEQVTHLKVSAVERLVNLRSRWSPRGAALPSPAAPPRRPPWSG